MRQLTIQAAVAAALGMAAASSAPAAEPNQIAPGYWETTNKVVSPFRTTKVERRCIRPQDVAKFMNGPSNHIYTCTYPTRVVTAGSIRLRGSCATKDGKPLPISGEGTFTRETFHMDAHVGAQLGPLQIPVHAVSDARRLSAECPAQTPPQNESKATNSAAADAG